jgi:hypothetical protein
VVRTLIAEWGFMKQHLENLLTKHINFATGTVQQASRSQNYVRDVLLNRRETDVDFPWLVDGDFLSGSYARGTKIYPLDDIDILMILDGEGFFAWKGGVRLDAVVRGGGTPGTPVGRLTNEYGGISSARVLEAFREVLGETYPASEIRKDGQAVNVWLDSYGLGLDVVPAFHIVPRDGGRELYYIPQGAGSTQWISTNPKIDARISEQLHAKHGRLLKSIVKLLKYWNTEVNAARLRPYHLEVVIWRTFDNHPGVISLEQGIRHFFDTAEGYIAGECKDITGVGEKNVDHDLDFSSRQATLASIRDCKAALTLASIQSALGMHDDAVKNWRKVFGSNFGN